MFSFLEFVQRKGRASAPKRPAAHGAWEFRNLSSMQKYNSQTEVTVETESKLLAFWSLNYSLGTVQENGKDNRVEISR